MGTCIRMGGTAHLMARVSVQDLHACLRGEHLSQASAQASPTAALRSSLPFGAGSPGALSAGVGPLGGAPGDAYASPTRVQSHSGIYGNVAHQVQCDLTL